MVDMLFFNPPKSWRRSDHVLNTAMLWLASGLLLQGRAATIRMPSGLNVDGDMVEAIEAERPRHVAISCKWWNTLYGAMEVARAVRRWFPGLPILTGGHTASVFATELVATGLFDVVLLGDVDQSLNEPAINDRLSHAYTSSGYHPTAQQSGPWPFLVTLRSRRWVG